MFFEKCGGKKNLVMTPSTRHGKIIFVLLDEVIIVYVGLTLVYIGGSGFKGLFPRFVRMVPGRTHEF